MTDDMRALVFEEPGRMTLRRVPTPKPADGELLVRVHAAAICGTDLRILAGTKTREVRPGHPIGHECAGTVAALGAGVQGYCVGQRVGLCVVVSCGTCPYCRSDRENLCESRITLGYATDGAFADLMLIPAQAVRRGNVVPLPDAVSIEAAALIEPLACCLNGQREMGLPALDGPARQRGAASLVIFGAGPIGLMHLLLARTWNDPPIRPIAVVEPQPQRQAAARSLGADAVYGPDAFEAAGQFDAAILAVGVPELVDTAIQAVRPCGRVSLFAGLPAGAPAEIDPNAVHYRQLRLYGASESRRRDYAEALSLVAGRRLDLAPLITHRFDLERYADAFRAAAGGKALKVMLRLVRDDA